MVSNFPRDAQLVNKCRSWEWKPGDLTLKLAFNHCVAGPTDWSEFQLNEI